MINFGKPTPKRSDLFEPIPAGEVTEGNEDADWAAWEDSVAFQDSMMPELQGSVTVSAGASAKPQPKPPAEPPTGPTIEVLEGNDESHWAEWEHSVRVQDSRMAGLQASGISDSASSADQPSTEHVDIFSSVHRKSA